jgi:hypothetical protein
MGKFVNQYVIHIENASDITFNDCLFGGGGVANIYNSPRVKFSKATILSSQENLFKVRNSPEFSAEDLDVNPADLAPRYYPILSSLQRFLVSA